MHGTARYCTVVAQYCTVVARYCTVLVLHGTAGDYQWGLDAGDHQDAYNPYDGLPDHWIHIDRVENYDNDEKVSDTLKFIV